MNYETDFLPDPPKGPLDSYRKQSSCNWKQLKIVFEDADLYKLKLKIWKLLEEDPIFARQDTELGTEELKRRTALQLNKYCTFNYLPSNINEMPFLQRTRLIMAANESLAVTFPDVSIKYALGISLFNNALMCLGTERHKKISDAIWNRKLLACLAITEVAHGSNTKQMRTTATYDKSTQEFIINTPDFEAAKCWVGNLGKTCTLAVLFAQLYTNNECHGLHAFVVPIRDPKTLLPFAGITVGDIGEKVGLHGIDNGFILFDNYRIPRENLLNRAADVTPEGEYESSFSEPNKILGAALECLSTGRVGIMQESVNNIICATTISTRYAAVRKQFGDNGSELPIIEYPLHQWRIFPYVAASAIFKLFIKGVTVDYLSALDKSKISAVRIDSLGELVSEIHAIVSAEKPLLTRTCMAAIQESREACGGHGYLKAARLGELRNVLDPSLTYEGDNNVLVQQTSNWLLRQWSNVLKGNSPASPLGTCSFLLDHPFIRSRNLNVNNSKEVLSSQFISRAYEWLIVYLLGIIHEEQSSLIEKGMSTFAARNHTQVYKCALLSRVYSEYTALKYFWKEQSKVLSVELKTVLNNLSILYGLWCLDLHLVYFYQGQFTTSPNLIKAVKDGVLFMCTTLKPDIIAVVDALAPPDYVVNSVLGTADGKVYENLEKKFLGNASAITRPNWWKEIIIDDAPDVKLLSKL